LTDDSEKDATSIFPLKYRCEGGFWKYMKNIGYSELSGIG